MPQQRQNNPAGGGRMPRLASLLTQQLSEYFQRELDLPGLVSISHVDVAPNFQSATVWLSIYGAEETEVISRIIKARKDIRYQLTRILATKYIPVLRFKADPSEAHAQRISEIIDDFEK
jgi:ribosome-binding factor A